MTNRINSEDHPEYLGGETKNTDDAAIKWALEILERRLSARREGEGGAIIGSPDDTKSFLRLKLAAREQEVFACLFLDNRHRVIRFEEMFYGTIDGASVYPREVVKRALAHNAAAVILTHNHPSGVAEPSRADLQITARLKEALSTVEVRVLDHIIVGEGPAHSFAEAGQI